MHTTGHKSAVVIYRYFWVSRHVTQFTIMCIVNKTSSRNNRVCSVVNNAMGLIFITEQLLAEAALSNSLWVSTPLVAISFRGTSEVALL